jgi:glycosyltransferase involved in cell wall biosynthesis
MVTVLMPAYNEAEIIEASVLEWHSEVTSRIPGAQLIVVNDCSKDNTAAILETITSRIPHIQCLTTPANGGHGRALRYGFGYIRTEFVFQTDSDRQHVPADFWKLWPLRESNDFVFGVRESRADGAVRKLITTVMQWANLLLWGVWIHDANCPFKLMRNDALQKVLARIPPDSFIPMVMVSILARRMKFGYTEVEVKHLPRTGGQQSLKGLWKWVKVGTRCFRQLLALRLSLPR